MVKNLFKEKLEFYKAEFKTKEGWFDFAIGSFIWGFVIISYINQIYGFITNTILSFLSGGILRNYIGYLILGIFSSALGLGITFALNKIFRFLFSRK